MPEKLMVVNGITRLVWVESLDHENWRTEEHQYRRELAMKRRRYFRGEQYQDENLDALQKEFAECSPAELLWKHLPEHQRKHAYSTQIKDGISFLASQIAENLLLDADDEDLQTWLDAFEHDSRLRHRWQEIVEDILITGDVAARLIPVRAAIENEPAVRVEFWRSEDIEIDYDQDDWRVIEEVRFEEFRNEPNADGENREVRYVHRFRMAPFLFADGEVREECVEEIWRDDLDEPIDRRRLGLPFIPWLHLSGEKQDLRSMWGKAMISSSLMENADRYNATNQLQYLAMRYNSFASVVVTGDQAFLTHSEGKQIKKDIADVLAFPGGSNVSALTLTTDVELFEVHKRTLEDSMWEEMGLSLIDSKDASSVGDISGYALEILNRKTDGTFNRIKGTETMQRPEAWF